MLVQGVKGQYVHIRTSMRPPEYCRTLLSFPNCQSCRSRLASSWTGQDWHEAAAVILTASHGTSSGELHVFAASEAEIGKLTSDTIQGKPDT